MAQARIANGENIVIVDMESALTPDLTADFTDPLHPNPSGITKWPMYGLPPYRIYCRCAKQAPRVYSLIRSQRQKSGGLIPMLYKPLALR